MSYYYILTSLLAALRVNVIDDNIKPLSDFDKIELRQLSLSMMKLVVDSLSLEAWGTVLASASG